MSTAFVGTDKAFFPGVGEQVAGQVDCFCDPVSTVFLRTDKGAFGGVRSTQVV